MNRRVLVAAAWAILVGALTFAAGPLTALSDHKVVAAIQLVLTYLMLPGLLVAAGVGSLGPGSSCECTDSLWGWFLRIFIFASLQTETYLIGMPEKSGYR